MPEPDPIPPRGRRPQFRPSVRALMVVVLVLGGWLGWVVHRARVQRQAVAAIQQAGGTVRYDSDFDIGNIPKRRVLAPRWLVDRLGIDYFSSVDDVRFHGPGADEVAGHLARLPELTIVDLNRSDLSDSGLARLRGLDLQWLLLAATRVTDAGVRHVRGMTNLEHLNLSITKVGDAGMADVATLPRLRLLMVSNTNVTDIGVGSIAKLPALKALDLSETRVGDAGAARLKSLSGLALLNLLRSRVTPAMIDELYPALPGVVLLPNPSPSTAGIVSPVP